MKIVRILLTLLQLLNLVATEKFDFASHAENVVITGKNQKVQLLPFNLNFFYFLLL